MKRLDIEERMIIQACLTKNMSLTEIAERLNRSKSTISREISRHLKIVEGTTSRLCTHSKDNFVCNSCRVRTHCTYRRHYYDFNEANDKASKIKRESRQNCRLSVSDIKRINVILLEGVRSLKQSLHHVYIANPELKEICSERTIRRLIYRRVVDVKAHELRRYVRFKHHKPKEENKYNLRDITVIIGRTYTDYLGFVEKHKRMNIVQYDSVIGKINDEKAILTITFKKYNFQFGLLINKGDSNDVRNKIRALFRKLGNKVVSEIFPINISDNGVEFSRFNEIEETVDGIKICRTFFTTPYRSNDKSECERNHEYVRYFIPKGISLDSLTQEKIDEMFSNINSTIRESKGNRTPYELVLRKYGKTFLDAINIKKVEKKRVNLNRIL